MGAELEKRQRVVFDQIEKVPVSGGELLRASASASLSTNEMERIISREAGLAPVAKVKANGTSSAPVDRLDYRLEANGASVTVSVSNNGAFGISVQSDMYDLEGGGVYLNPLRTRLMQRIINALEAGDRRT